MNTRLRSRRAVQRVAAVDDDRSALAAAFRSPSVPRPSVRPLPSLPPLLSSQRRQSWSFITRARTSTSASLARPTGDRRCDRRRRQSFLIQPLALSRWGTKSERR